MHELGVTQGIVDMAIARAREAGAKKVLDITLVIGEASSIIDDCVQFCFDFVSRETMAEGARLRFERVPLTMKCRRCGSLFSPRKEAWTCPQCKEWDAEIVKGTEFYMESIEVE